MISFERKLDIPLTFMNEGDAKSWKDQFLENASTTGMYDLGT